MGCASSKFARKHATKDGWYAPLSRSISAPIHHPAENEGDSCHVVSLTSSSYGILKMEKPGYQSEDVGSFVGIAKNTQDFMDDQDDFVFLSGSDVKQMVANMKLKPLKEGEDEGSLYSDGDLETINTWELMEGLEEGGGRTPSPLRGFGAGRRRLPERSLSFDTAQGLDSCFGEMGSPNLSVWRKYLQQEELEKENAKAWDRSYRRSESPMTPPSKPLNTAPMTPSTKPLKEGEARTISPMESLDGNSGLKLLLSPAISPQSSPFREDAPSHGTSLSFDGDTERLYKGFSRSSDSFDSRSPLKSPDLKGSSSPLFDPALVATFEQALEAVAVSSADYDWLSTTTSSSENNSSSSETSSDADSPHLQQRPGSVHQPEKSVFGHVWNSREKKIASSKVSPVDDYEKQWKKEESLESFDERCPPGGEMKVVLYFTSLRGVRKTYEDCCHLRQILQGLGVHVDERDVWMHSKFREELTGVVGKMLPVPRLFIKGRYIGGAEEVKQLHEDGKLAKLLEGLPTDVSRKVCDGCGDMRFIPCLTCSGSCKLINEQNEVTRCPGCNENGLMMCPICS